MNSGSFWKIGMVLLCVCAGCQSTVNVKKQGALGDGKALDTAAFQAALDACKKSGGEVVVPAGNYVIGSIVMSSNTTLRLNKGATLIGSANPDDYPIMSVRWEGRWKDGHRALIHAKDAQHIAIVGEGAINGDMKIGNLRDPRGPCIFEPIECKDVRLEGITINYRRMWACHLTYCDDVHVKGLTIRSAQSNGDGIDIDSSKNVWVEKCDIDAGDDAIVLKSGRGMEGYKIARPTENVTVTDCRLGSGFAGMAVGTEMSGGVRNLKFSHCTFTRGANAIYIKSRVGRGGFMENIEGDDLVSSGARTFLHLDLIVRGIQDSEPVQGIDGVPYVANVKVSNAKVDCQTLVDATQVSADKPVENLSITNITGTCRKAIALSNIKNVEMKDIQVSGYEGPFVTETNVTGSGIDKIKEPEDTQSK
jgi:polygalacturonase